MRIPECVVGWGSMRNCEDSHSLGLWFSPRKREGLLPAYRCLGSLSAALQESRFGLEAVVLV
jgi:hypothetical protein